MKFPRLLLGVFLSLGLGACAFDPEDAKNSRTGKELRDREELLQNFARVTGTWTGRLQEGTRQDPVELVLYTLEERRGTTSDGEIITQPVLYGRFRTTELLRFDVNLQARYFPETGQLLLLKGSSGGTSSAREIFAQSTGGTSSGLPPATNEIHSLDLVVAGEQISGQVKAPSGVLGQVSLQLASRESRLPDSSGDLNDINDRLRRLYEPLVGTYEGKVESDPRSIAPFCIRVRLFLSQTQTSRGPVVTLSANYRRSDDSTGALELSMAVTYKPETTPAQIIATSQGIVQRPGNFFVTLDGFLEGQQIRAQHTTQRGLTGPVLLSPGTRNECKWAY